MRIGIDFDNTIICYNQVFNKIALEHNLIPETLPYGKNYVRDYLRKIGKENEWIKMQGYVYGKRLNNAEPYDGVKNFILFCQNESIQCFIISHKTKYPYSKDKYNLHDAASVWIDKQNIECPVYFEPTKEDKIRRLNELKCTYFIDDLPEFLCLPGFNSNIIKILFDPQNRYLHSESALYRVNSWQDIFLLIKASIV